MVRCDSLFLGEHGSVVVVVVVEAVMVMKVCSPPEQVHGKDDEG